MKKQIPALIGSIDAADGPLDSLARRIKAEHGACTNKVREGLNHAIRAGQLLRQAKSEVKHGQWAAWVAAHCGCSLRTAQGYMRVARNAEKLASKSATAAPLTLRGAIELLAESIEPPEPTGAEGPMTLAEAEASIERSLDHAFEAARELISLREIVGPERFAEWLGAHEPYLQKAFSGMMKAAADPDLDRRKIMQVWIDSGAIDDLLALDEPK